MEVSSAVKQAYQSNSITRHVTLYFPELGKEVGMKQIYYETMRLSEKLTDSDSIEFVGCISSKFKIQVNNLQEDIKGKKIEVKIHTDGTESEPVPLFKGIVDSALKQANKRIKEITAYDELYTKGNIDVATWYKGLTFPITLKSFRYSLFQYIGLTQVEVSLPNDDIEIKKQYNPSALQALAVIKAICQINGAFGIINREGIFEYRILGNIENDAHTVATFYPNPNFFSVAASIIPGSGSIETTDFPFYKTVSYEEFKVKPVDKLTIRQDEDHDGITYGTGDNNYIIQGNMFTYGLSDSILQTIAQNIYGNVQGFSYYPFTSDNNGLPYLECGLDAVSYTMIDWENSESGDITYEQQSFYILNRELKGIQNLRDSYSAEGEEYQTEFVTDLQTQIDLIRKKSNITKEDLDNDYYNKEEIDQMFAEGGGGGGYTIESVKTPPSSGKPYTMYCIQGEIRVE